jgi:hypothetical protein
MEQDEIQRRDAGVSSHDEDDPAQLKCKKCHKKRPVTGTTRIVRKAGKDVLTPWRTIGVVLARVFCLLVGALAVVRVVSGFGGAVSRIIVGVTVGATVGYLLFFMIQTVIVYFRSPHFEVRFFHCNNCGSLLKAKHLRRLERVGG